MAGYAGNDRDCRRLYLGLPKEAKHWNHHDPILAHSGVEVDPRDGRKYNWYEASNTYPLASGLEVKASFWNDEHEGWNHRLVLEQFYTMPTLLKMPNTVFKLIWHGTGSGTGTGPDTTKVEYFVIADGQDADKPQKCTLTAMNGQSDFSLETYVLL